MGDIIAAHTRYCSIVIFILITAVDYSKLRVHKFDYIPILHDVFLAFCL